jgi:sulfonate transport system substrate-binding protein
MRWAPTLLLGTTLVTCSLSCKESGRLRVGYQKFGALLPLKERGLLEQALAPSGVTVQWIEFPAGPPIMEALRASDIDIGMTGEAPPVFAQANGDSFVYVGCEPPAPHAEALLVRQESPIGSTSELRRKRVAVNRGSNAHYFLAAALEKAGVSYGEVSVVFLAPADARVAFEQGNVDAWAIWDPYMSSEVRDGRGRVLRDAEGVADNVVVYLATAQYAKAHADTVAVVLREIGALGEWVDANRQDAAAALAAAINMNPLAIEDSLAHSTFRGRPMAADCVDNQQRVADTFLGLGLLPKAIHVSDALLASRQ